MHASLVHISNGCACVVTHDVFISGQCDHRYWRICYTSPKKLELTIIIFKLLTIAQTDCNWLVILDFGLQLTEIILSGELVGWLVGRLVGCIGV